MQSVAAPQIVADTAPHPWDALHAPQTPCLVLPAQQWIDPSILDEVCALPDLPLRFMGSQKILLDDLSAHLPAPLTDYIARLLATYDAFMRAPVMRVRLELVTGRTCWKWHQDFVTLRLISTLRGPGTEYLPNADRPEQIAHCLEGDIGLFKGRLFSDHMGQPGHQACVHRSPPWEENSVPRLLLVIDTPQDFEIERP